MNENPLLLLDFKTGSDAELIVFAVVTLLRTKGVPAYDPVRPQVEKVDASLLNFNKAVSDALSGGTEEKDIRKEKRDVLEADLDTLGNAIIANANGDPLYVVNANFKLRDTKSSRTQQPLEDPVWANLQRGVLSGTVKGEVKNFPKGATGVQPQWRPKGENGESWTSGRPSSGKRFEMAGLPVRTEVEVQVRFFGTYQRESNWSKPFPVDVL